MLANSLIKPASLNIIKHCSRRSSDYLHRSILATNHFQDALPRLPVPKLEDSMAKYIRSLEALEGHPFVQKQNIEETKRTINKFMQTDGPYLQYILEKYDKDNSHTSYLAQAWFDMYLESRLPIVLNYNPFLLLNPDPNPAMNDQLLRTTNMLISSLKFMKTFDAGILKPEVFYMKNTAKSENFQRFVKYLPSAMKMRYIPMALNGAYPLDMSQYKNLLCSTRIPCEGKDILRTYKGSKHMLIIRNGNMYTFDVLDKSGNILPASQIYNSLKSIVEDKTPSPMHNLAYLTSEERNTWASLRQHLVNTGNASALSSIDSAIYCISFDDETIDIEDVEKCTEKFLYGSGTSLWFDKSITFIVSKNGQVGANFEHSWGDGVAVLRFIHEVFDDSIANPYVTAPVEDSASPIRRLEFNLDDKMKNAIDKAKQTFHSNTSKIKVSAQKYQNLNKNYLKQKKVSPDGILQLAVQIGHRKMYGHPTATYESCSTSAFKHGRTETLRSCTLEAQEVAKLIVQSGSAKIKTDNSLCKQLNHLINESCKKHNELTKEAAMGQGFDRHLFVLKYLAERVVEKNFTPSLHQDQLYQIMNHFVLSTSTLSSHAMQGGGFAPVVPDGFGVGYGVRDEFVGVNITSYENRDVHSLVNAIVESFDDIYTVLESK